MSGKWNTTYEFNNNLLNLRSKGVRDSTRMYLVNGNEEDADHSLTERMVDAIPAYAKGMAAQIPLTAITIAAHKKAQLEAQEMAKARAAWYDANAVSKPEQLIQKAASGAEITPMQQPAKVGLRRVAQEAMRSLPETAGTMLKGAGIGQAVVGAIEGAHRGYNTPTETYAKRNNMAMPTSTAGQVGLRGLGVMQDVGNAVTFGMPEKYLWPKE